MRSWRLATIVAAAFVGACAQPETRREPTVSNAPAATGVPKPRKPDAVIANRLPERAFELWMHGGASDVYEMLSKELATRVKRGEWNDARFAAETATAAEMFTDVADTLECWPKTRDVLASFEPMSPNTPPEIVSILEHERALALRNTGRFDEARNLTQSLGVTTDWLVIGPFGNERGKGFDDANEPEKHIELSKPTKGKDRDVRWRKNPCPEHPLGRVVLEPMFHPASQVAAYLATALETDRERELVFEIGSSCALKVVVDGHEALARKVRRPFHFDQDSVVLALAPGTHQLLVKLAIEEWPDWVFEGRFTELDGRACTDLRIDSAKVADATLAFAEPKSKRAPNSREILGALDKDPDALRMRAYLELAMHPDDVSAKSTLAWATKARDLEPQNVWALYELAQATATETGQTKEEREINPHLAALRAVIERDPVHVSALCDLADFYANDDPIPMREFEYASRAARAAPNSWRANQALARALEARGSSAESERVEKLSLALPVAEHLQQAVFARFERKWTSGKRDDAIAELERSFAERCTPGPIFRRLCELAVDAGRLDGDFRSERPSLRSLADELFAGTPYDVDAALDVSRLFALSKSLDLAEKYLDRAFAIAPEEPKVLLARADLAERKSDVKAADRALAEVLRIDPGHDKARRRRALLAVEAQDRFEAPYRTDAREIAKSAPPPSGENEAIELLDRECVYRLSTDGTSSNYEHLVMRVQNLGGVKALDNYAIGYDEDSTLQVLELRVIHADGSVTNAPAPRRDGRNGDHSVRRFDIPPLAIGDVVDVEYRIDQNAPGVFGQYFGLRYEFYPDTIDGLAPTLRSELVVIAPKGLELYPVERNAGELERSKETGANGATIYRWTARDLKRPPIESAMPQRSEFAPVVDVTTYASWDEFAKWWWHFIEKDFVTSPEMKAKVKELTAGLATEREKVQAITRFVGQQIRYNAWEFGTHGYEPYSASTIFERRFGDCKDKSILLRQLLAEIGVVAHPVLIKAEYYRPDEPLAAAMVEHFNHCIAYVPATKDHEGYYLDATADRNPLDYLRADDQGAHVLHVDEHGGSIHEIPYAPTSENTQRHTYRVVLAADGSATVDFHDASNGVFGVQTRYQYGGEKGDLAKRFGDAIADAFGKVEVSKITTSDLEDIGAPAKLDATFSAKALWAHEERGASLRSTFERLSLDSIAVETPESRHFDVVLDRPFADDTTVTYVLPKGAKTVELPRSTTVGVPGIFDYSIDYKQDGDEIVVHRKFELKVRRVALASYASFRNGVHDLRQAEDRPIVVAPPPAGDRGGDK